MGYAVCLGTITDEPLLTEQGHTIGVRLTYRVSFPTGLSALNQEPPPMRLRQIFMCLSHTARSWTSRYKVQHLAKWREAASAPRSLIGGDD